MELLFIGLKLVDARFVAISMFGSGIGIGISFAGFLIQNLKKYEYEKR